MGVFWSQITENAAQSEEHTKTAKDLHNLVRSIAASSSKVHENFVTKQAIASEILPVKRLLHQTSVSFANVDAQRADSLKSILVHPFFDTIDNDRFLSLAKRSIERLKTNSGDDSSEITDYTITVGKQGAVTRVDYSLTYGHFNSQAFSAIADSYITMSIIVSSTDLSKLKSNDIELIINHNYSEKLVNEDDKAYEERLKKLIALVISGNAVQHIGS